MDSLTPAIADGRVPFRFSPFLFIVFHAFFAIFFFFVFVFFRFFFSLLESSQKLLASLDECFDASVHQP